MSMLILQLKTGFSLQFIYNVTSRDNHSQIYVIAAVSN